MSDNSATHMLVEPPCGVCGRPVSRIELVPPDLLPVAFGTWNASARETYEHSHNPAFWRLTFQGIEAGNGLGDDIGEDRAGKITAAFVQPYEFIRIHSAGFCDDAGFCGPCNLPIAEHTGTPRPAPTVPARGATGRALIRTGRPSLDVPIPIPEIAQPRTRVGQSAGSRKRSVQIGRALSIH
jgi:hypothetical protein